MWVKLNKANKVVAEYARPVPLRFRNVLFPATVFRNTAKLREMDIYPLRRVQLNAPDDTTGWKSTYVDTAIPGLAQDPPFVLREVTWSNFDEKVVAERDAKLARQEWDARRAAVADYLYETTGTHPADNLLAPADRSNFDAWYAARQVTP